MISVGTTSRVVTWIEPTAVDNSGGQPTVIRSHQPGSTFPVGTTQVTYTFRDAVGNEATCSFEITGNFFKTSVCCMLAVCFSHLKFSVLFFAD